jgi:hypothetical protein
MALAFFFTPAGPWVIEKVAGVPSSDPSPSLYGLGNAIDDNPRTYAPPLLNTSELSAPLPVQGEELRAQLAAAGFSPQPSPTEDLGALIVAWNKGATTINVWVEISGEMTVYQLISAITNKIELVCMGNAPSVEAYLADLKKVRAQAQDLKLAKAPAPAWYSGEGVTIMGRYLDCDLL